MNNKMNVLILETNPIWEKSLKDFYTSTIEACGYQCNFIFIDKAKGEVIETKKNESIFDKHEIDLFISDLSLGVQEGPLLGLTVIKKVKEEFPELVVIANSTRDVGSKEISQSYPSFDLCINKSNFSIDSYKTYISKLLDKTLNRNIYLTLNIEKSVFPAKYHIEKKSEQVKLINLLKFITYNGKEKARVVTEVILKSIEDGKSNSFVFQMDGHLSNGLKCINSIIKISNKDKSRVEKENYDRFVKWTLPYTWRTELLAYAEWQDQGCICYSYAFDNDSIKSVTDYIKKNKYNKILQVLNTIFNPDKVTWYSKKNIGTHPSILNYYFQKWFNGRKSPNDSIKKIIAGTAGKFVGSTIRFGSHVIPEPDSFLLADRGECLTCVCHGDLNSNNILLSESAETPVLIDFQDTGTGHVFVDFVVFENCFRSYYDQNKTLEELIEYELELNKILEEDDLQLINSNGYEMADILIKLRRAAFATFPGENRWTYIYGLAMSSYSRLRDIERLERWQINQVFASLMAAIITLSNMKVSKNVSHTKPKDPKVFASFNTKDIEFVKKVAGDLGEKGIEVWLNATKPGDNFINKIDEAIKDSVVYLYFCSDAEGYYQAEGEKFQIHNYKKADSSKVIIPCIVENTLNPLIPGLFSHLVIIDFNTNYQGKINELAERINELLRRRE